MAITSTGEMESKDFYQQKKKCLSISFLRIMTVYGGHIWLSLSIHRIKTHESHEYLYESNRLVL